MPMWRSIAVGTGLGLMRTSPTLTTTAPIFDRRKEIDDMLVDLEVEWDDLDCNKKTRKVHADIFPDTVDSDTWPAAYEWLVAALGSSRRHSEGEELRMEP